MEHGRWPRGEMPLTDLGAEPAIINLGRLTRCSGSFCRSLWTGQHLQLILMCIPAGEEIGPEVRRDTDQLLFIESGCALVKMGYSEQKLTRQQRADGGFAIFVPAGIWHNIINVGAVPLKLSSVYAPSVHPYGTVLETKRDAESEA